MYEKWEKLKANAEFSILQEDFEQAERYWTLALEESAASNSPLRGCICLDGLGDLYYNQERFAESEEQYSTALHIRAEALGDQHTEVGVTFNNLAAALCAQGKLEEAAEALTAALAILINTYGISHTETRWTIKTLMDVYSSLGKSFEVSEASGWIRAAAETENRQSLREQPICGICGRPYYGYECLQCTRTQLKSETVSAEALLLTVVCAKKDIRAGCLITWEFVETGHRVTTPDVFFENFEHVVGKTAGTFIPQGQAIKFTDVES
jgi:tetratricopeptide (TPR) repeat protein